MKLGRFAVLSVAVLSLTGCIAGTYTGGGWTPSPYDAEAKATFGGNFHAIDVDGDGEVFDWESETFDPDDSFKGQFQYNDHGADVAFHGVVDGAYFSTEGNICGAPCDRPSLYSIIGSAYFEGTYTPVPKKIGPGGRFEALLIDNGEPGADAGDELWIVCTSGVFAGYNSDTEGAFRVNG